MTQQVTQQPIESPEGWRAWPLWLRLMLIVMALLIVAGIVVVATSLPANARNIEIVAAPEMDFISFVIPYRSSGQMFVPASGGIGQAERICIGIDISAYGDIPVDVDMVTMANATTTVTLNEAPVPAENIAFAYDPTVVGIIDSAGQTIGQSNGTIGVCFRTSSYPEGDYIGAVTITRLDNSTRFYDWAFTIG